MKRILSIILVMALATPLFWLGNPLSPALTANAESYRKGYELRAESSDKTGVSLESSYLLKVPASEVVIFSGEGTDQEKSDSLLNELQKRLTIRTMKSTVSSGITNISGIEGEAVTPAALTLSIELKDSETFTVKPSVPLEANTLYYFDVEASDGEIVHFAFQTMKEFGVLGVLPANMSSGVPVDTGIEFYFTHSGMGDLTSFFEITPAVAGRFESHGQTVAFVPSKPLQTGTIYRITLKEGLTLPDTEQKISGDYIFSFETNPDPEKSANPDNGYLGINNNWLEYSTSDKPVIPFDIYLPDSLAPDGQASVSVTVYGYQDDKAFVNALEQKDKVPYWAWYGSSKNLLSTAGLKTALQYQQPINFIIQDARYTELPEKLPAGFYLVEIEGGSTKEPLKAQAMLQVTDTTAWFIEDETSMLFWVNSYKTGNPINQMKVENLSTKLFSVTNTEGLAKISKPLEVSTQSDVLSVDNAEAKETTTRPQILPPSDKPVYFRFSGSDGSVYIMNSGYPLYTGNGSYYNLSYGYYNRNEGDYWKYSGLDRTLYKPSDIVHYWGFARNRVTGTSPSEVTIELSQGGWMYPWMDTKMGYWMPMSQKPLLTKSIPVKNGFWDSSVALPSLEPGYYNLTVKSGNETITTSGFSVENYVKPAYQLIAKADKEAVFPGEEVQFTVTASFFDGTPVVNQPIRYTIQEPNGSVNNEGKTNENGELTVTYTAQYFNEMQGEFWLSFYANAQLPEAGEINANTYTRVFMNDIAVETIGDIVNSDGSPVVYNEKKDAIGRVFIAANQVNLKPLLDDDPDNDAQVKGVAVANHEFKGIVKHTTWERIEIGETYDFINKVVVQQYEYQEKVEIIADFSVMTDSEGKATYEFPIAKDATGYYTTEISTNDGNNHPMRFSTWHSSYGRGYPNQGTWYNLKTNQDLYRVGDKVSAQMTINDEQNASGRTLFVASWHGIQSYTLAQGTKYETIYSESMAPNFTLDGVLFDGRNYRNAQANISYDYEEKRISFQATTDKDAYRPGDTVELTIKATDPDGNPAPSTLNVALVDEALFKLSEQYNDVLPTLYSWMDNGILRRYDNNSYNRGYLMLGGREMGGMAQEAAMDSSKSSEMPAPSTAAMMDVMKGDGGGDEASYTVRSDFRDSAYFKVAETDETGTSVFTFKLPDNITAWRISISGISQTLQGGSGTESATVSLPFFLSESINETYMKGDEPQFGVTAYGSELKAADDVTFSVTSTDLPQLQQTITAKAFERVHLPLGQLQEGTYTFVIKAITSAGLTDAVERTVTVVGSYREMQKSVSAKLTNGMTVAAGTKGLTRLTITDPERAAILQTLQEIAFSNGHRLDQRLVAASAQKWLNELLKDETTGMDVWDVENVDVESYHRQDGGYGILPYAESDMRLTALLTDLLKENGSTEALKAWLYGKLYSSDTPSPQILYALSVLGEPVLMELNMAAEVETKSSEDALFLILAYASVGDLPSAYILWDKNIAPLLEKEEPYVRMKTDSIELSDKDERLQLTALASAAAAVLQLSEAEGLHLWVQNNPSKNVYLGIENLMYAKAKFVSLPGEELSFTWSYAGTTKTEVLKNGTMAFITIVSTQANELQISNVTGNGVVTSTFVAPREPVKNDSNISIRRTYYNATTGEAGTTFHMNDLIRVELDWNINSNALDRAYDVTDTLPAGLSSIQNPWQYGIQPAEGFWYRNFEGQQVSFVIGRDWDLQKKIVYYARVSSPGTYTAEGTIVEGSLVKGSSLEIPSVKVVIEAN